MTIRVGPAGTRGARVPNRGLLAALFRLMGKRQVRTYRRFGGQRLSSRMGFPVGPSHLAWSEDGADPVGIQASEQGRSGGGVTDI